MVGKHRVQITMMAQDDNPADDRPQRSKRLPAGYRGRNTKLEYDVPAILREIHDVNRDRWQV